MCKRLGHSSVLPLPPKHSLIPLNIIIATAFSLPNPAIAFPYLLSLLPCLYLFFGFTLPASVTMNCLYDPSFAFCSYSSSIHLCFHCSACTHPAVLPSLSSTAIVSLSFFPQSLYFFVSFVLHIFSTLFSLLLSLRSLASSHKLVPRIPPSLSFPFFLSLLSCIFMLCFSL